MEDPVGITFEILKLQEKLHNKLIKCISRKKVYKFVQEWLENYDPEDNSSEAEVKDIESEPKYEQLRFDLLFRIAEDHWDPF